jgi:hypothetical protein
MSCPYQHCYPCLPPPCLLTFVFLSPCSQ